MLYLCQQVCGCMCACVFMAMPSDLYQNWIITFGINNTPKWRDEDGKTIGLRMKKRMGGEKWLQTMFIIILFNNLDPILPVLLAYESLEITQICVEGFF